MSLEELLKPVDGVGQYSGGCTPFEDMALFQKVKKDETVLWYHTAWLPTNTPDEQKQVIVFQRVRKATQPKDSR